MTEEIFGPISPCMKVGSMEEVLAISNSLEMGLAAFVFKLTETANRLAHELQVGSVAVNTFTSPGAASPFLAGIAKAA